MEIIREYTRSDYRRLNRAINRGEQIEGIAELNAALESLPAYPGISFRSIWIDDLTAYVAILKGTATLTFAAFTSTSESEAIARDFNGNVLFIIDGKSGRDIAKFSDAPHEQEILFGSGKTFQVKKVKINKVAGHVWSIEVNLIEK